MEFTWAGMLHVAIVIGIGGRVITRRRPVGVTLAWLMIVLVLPLFGAIAYLLIGENRLGEARARRVEALAKPYRAWLREMPRSAEIDWSKLSEDCWSLHNLARNTAGIPALAGNALRLHCDARTALRAMIDDVRAARRTIHMEFYIWEPGGLIDDLHVALIEAARRGVRVRLLVDAVGSFTFLAGSRVRELEEEEGIELVPALPVGVLRSLFVRIDHRNHRKIAVIDGRIGWTGSMNAADPEVFKKTAGVGEWIDCMVRVEGPAVEGLAITFLADWELETGVGLEELAEEADVRSVEVEGTVAAQVVPSGPETGHDAIHELLLTTIYAAHHEITLTTPYFVPDDAIVIALKSVARRGVKVTVIVPEEVDSRIMRYASPWYFEDLLAAGVRIAVYHGGLLHSKVIAVDGRIGVIGSVNLDMRSLRLNFEISLFVYDAAFTQQLSAMQEGFLQRSTLLELDRWRQRPLPRRLAESCARLLGPLL